MRHRIIISYPKASRIPPPFCFFLSSLFDTHPHPVPRQTFRSRVWKGLSSQLWGASLIQSSFIPAMLSGTSQTPRHCLLAGNAKCLPSLCASFRCHHCFIVSLSSSACFLFKTFCLARLLDVLILKTCWGNLQIIRCCGHRE